MRKYFERASSTERRFVTATFLILFLALNWIFVWPLFSDWAKYEARREKAQHTLKTFEDAIAQAEKLKPKVKELEGEGMAVPAEDQTVKFMGTVQSQAAASSITIQNIVPGQSRTNQFFVEKALAATFTAGEGELVDFLYKLGTGESLVRVRGLSLRPDPPRHLLQANLTLVASYQKKAPARATTPTSVPASSNTPPPAAKPAAVPVAKPKTNSPAKSDQPVKWDKLEKPGGRGLPKPSTPTKKSP